MIRPLTCICVLLAGGSGLYLYQSKHQAQMLDREIARTLKAVDVARDRIGVLRGEWALLNEPERLAELSQAHLGLKTLSPSQFATAAELGARLPPPVLPGTVTVFAEEVVSPPTRADLPAPPLPALTTPAAAPVAPARANIVVAKQPSPTQNQLAALPPTPLHPTTRTIEARNTEHREDAGAPRPPIQVASALPMPTAPLAAPRPAPAHPVMAPVVNVSVSPIVAAPLSAPRPVQARPASVHPASPGSSAAVALPRSAPQMPENSSIGESVARMTRLQGASASAAIPGNAQPSSYAQPSHNPASASALGGNRPLLPPPVPFGSAMAASGPNAR